MIIIKVHASCRFQLPKIWQVNILRDFGVGWMYIVNEWSIKLEKLDIIHSVKISGYLDVGEDQNSIMQKKRKVQHVWIVRCKSGKQSHQTPLLTILLER